MTKRILVVLIAMVVANIPAHAFYTCSGPVTQLSIRNDGAVNISVGGITNGYLCQIGATTNGVGPDTCKAMYAQLLIAEATGRSMTLYFNPSGTITSCSAQVPYAWLAGFYFGPGNF